MKLNGLKIVFLGDSITEGACASQKENQYVELIASKTGAVCKNFGIGGTRIARQNKKSECEIFDQDFCSRYHEMDSDADIVVVFGGTNDYGHGDAIIGNPTDTTPNTFHGAVNYLMNALKCKYPASKIVFITPMHRIGDTIPQGEVFKAEIAPVLSDYVEIIKESALKNNILLLDFYNDLGINPNNPADNEQYFADGLHPNDSGHELIAEKIISFLEM